MQAAAREIKAIAGPRARFGEPLRRYTTWRVGGPGWCVVRVESVRELEAVVEVAVGSGLPWKVLGRGSNILALDEGYPGVIVLLRGELARIQRQGQRLVCGAGAGLPKAVRIAAEAGLEGLEWAVGIPASVGGAAATNAGAGGGEMARVVEKLEILVPGEGTRIIQALPGGYRSPQLPHGAIATRVWLRLGTGQPAAVRARRRELLEARRKSQPLSEATAGCVFKNPPGQAAGRLIEACGLKGKTIGRAKVSEVHANFIVNTGGARAGEILELMELMAGQVKERFGVGLEPEVEVLRW